MSKFTRIVGGVRLRFRLYGGWEQRDAVTYKGKTLKGFIRLRRQNGEQVEETCFKNVKGTVESVPGCNLGWLAHKNNLTVKV